MAFNVHAGGDQRINQWVVADRIPLFVGRPLSQCLQCGGNCFSGFDQLDDGLKRSRNLHLSRGGAGQTPACNQGTPCLAVSQQGWGLHEVGLQNAHLGFGEL